MGVSSFSVSACVPAQNEAGNVDRLVRDLDAVLAAAGRDYEIIVVDDGSRDATPRLLAALAAATPALRVITHAEGLGYGRSLRDAFAAARKDYIFYTDGDAQYDAADIPAFLPHLDGANAVVGYRAARAEGLLRHLSSRAYNAFVRVLFGLKLRDIDCSFKFLPRRALQALALSSDKFFIDAEFMLKLAWAGTRVVELPVGHRPRRHGRSTVSPVHVFTTLRETFALRRELGQKKRAPTGPDGS